MGVCTSESGNYSSFEKLDRLKLAFKDQDQIVVKSLLQELSQPQEIFYNVPPALVQHVLHKPSANFAAMALLYICDSKMIQLQKEKPAQFRTKKTHPTEKVYTPLELIRGIHAQLTNDNIVGIMYNGNVLYSPEPRTEGRHASTVVGRRWNKDHCEVLIRNSWGPNCGTQKNPQYYSFEACEQGYLWMSEEQLQPQLFGITYLPRD